MSAQKLGNMFKVSGAIKNRNQAMQNAGGMNNSTPKGNTPKGGKYFNPETKAFQSKPVDKETYETVRNNIDATPKGKTGRYGIKGLGS